MKVILVDRKMNWNFGKNEEHNFHKLLLILVGKRYAIINCIYLFISYYYQNNLSNEFNESLISEYYYLGNHDYLLSTTLTFSNG